MTNSLLVVWQDVISRQKYQIGTLCFNVKTKNYEFSYAFDVERRGLQDALNVGFTGIHEFEMTDGIVYSSDLFHFFNKRLPNPKRSDYNKLLEYFGLNESSSKMEFLRRTKGKLGTDSFELFSPIVKDEDNSFSLESFIEGWQYYDGDTELINLKIDDELKLVREPDNKKDKYAVKVLTKTNAMLGYIAAVHSESISKVIENNQYYKVIISNIYPNAIPQMKVWMEVRGQCSFQSFLELGEKSNSEKELVHC